MRTVMVGRRYELFKIVKPYLRLEEGKMFVLDNAPDSVKKAFEEYLNMPSISDGEASFTKPLDKTQQQAYNIKVICFRAE